ncbi:hypothetical protein [Listeria monocytogenes]|nr:hypothetical protein [Listeria monocytogenes]
MNPIQQIQAELNDPSITVTLLLFPDTILNLDTTISVLIYKFGVHART